MPLYCKVAVKQYGEGSEAVAKAALVRGQQESLLFLERASLGGREGCGGAGWDRVVKQYEEALVAVGKAALVRNAECLVYQGGSQRGGRMPACYAGRVERGRK